MRRNPALGMLVLLLVSSCSGGTGASVEIGDAWARTSPAMTSAGAVYLQIHNHGDTDDALLRATVDPSVAETVEIHETVPAETSPTMGGHTGSTHGGGMMTMRPVEQIAIPAGTSVSLEPGGFHVMLIGLVEPLESGGTLTITLTFEEAGEVEVVADVRDSAP